MFVEKTEVAIVGGGIAGLSVAKFLGENGIPFILMEEHTKFFKKPCGEITFPEIAGYSFYDFCDYGIERELQHICIHTKYGEINAEIPILILNKLEMEEEMARQARKYGEILMGEKVLFIENGVLHPQKIKAKIIVGADGVFSVVRKYMGVKEPKTGFAAQTYLENVNMDKDCAHIILRDNVIKYGYAWYFPKKENWNVGIGSFKTEFFKKSFPNFRKIGSEWKGFHFPAGMPTKSYGKNAILVGDSASHIMAAAGAGIFSSMIIAKIASQFIGRFLEGKAKLKDFEKEWKKEIGKQFRYAYLASINYWKILRSEYMRYIVLRRIAKKSRHFYKALQRK